MLSIIPRQVIHKLDCGRKEYIKNIDNIHCWRNHKPSYGISFSPILTDNMPREKYSTHPINKSSYHIGQLKLLLSEILILLDHADIIFKDGKGKIIMLVAGGAPGTHYLTLSKLFPSINIILYDYGTFDKDMCKYPKIQTFQEIFTDDTAAKYNNDGNDILIFVSDIRSQIHNKSPQEVETIVMNDMKMQEKWVQIINPDLAILKFRAPYLIDPKMNTSHTRLSGKLYKQAYAGASSTELRLAVTRPFSIVDYDSLKIEEQMFYHNSITRCNCYDHDCKYGLLDSCYDCKYLAECISRYSILKKDKHLEPSMKNKEKMLNFIMKPHINKLRILRLNNIDIASTFRNPYIVQVAKEQCFSDDSNSVKVIYSGKYNLKNGLIYYEE